MDRVNKENEMKKEDSYQFFMSIRKVFTKSIGHASRRYVINVMYANSGNVKRSV